MKVLFLGLALIGANAVFANPFYPKIRSQVSVGERRSDVECANFTGNWQGRCEIATAGESFDLSVPIHQYGCEMLSMDGDILGFDTMNTKSTTNLSGSQVNEKLSQSTEVRELRWSKDFQNLVIHGTEFDHGSKAEGPSTYVATYSLEGDKLRLVFKGTQSDLSTYSGSCEFTK